MTKRLSVIAAVGAVLVMGSAGCGGGGSSSSESTGQASLIGIRAQTTGTSGTTNRFLDVINTSTGTAQSISLPAITSNITATAYDASNNTFYCSEYGTDKLYQINVGTGVILNTFSTAGNYEGLAFDTGRSELIGIRASGTSTFLDMIDPTTGSPQSTSLPAITSNITATAYEQSSQTFYCSEYGTDKLYAINAGTGTIENTFSTAGIYEGLAFDTGRSKLIGIRANDTGTFLDVIEPATGSPQSTSLSAITSNITATAYDQSNQTFYCSEYGTDKLYKINVGTGVIINTFSTAGDYEGLAFKS